MSKLFRKHVICVLIISSLFLISLSSAELDAVYSNKQNSLSENVYVRYHGVEVDIMDSATVKAEESFVIQNNNSESISSVDLWFNHSLISLSVYDTEGILIYDWSPNSNTSHLVTVYFRYNLSQTEITSFSVSYDFSFNLPLIEDDINYYFFEYYSSITYPTAVLEVSFILPENSYIHDGDLSPFYPQNVEQSINYNRIKLKWTQENLEPTTNPLFFIRFDEPMISEEEKGFFQKTFNVFISGLLFGIFLGISMMSWLARYREKKAKKKMGQSLLDEKQMDLIRKIYEHQGKITQKELCDVTGFSKSKVSRNLVPLEKQGLIHREKWGRTYVVRLTKEGRAVIE